MNTHLNITRIISILKLKVIIVCDLITLIEVEMKAHIERDKYRTQKRKLKVIM